jgi:hypothetical protein
MTEFANAIAEAYTLEGDAIELGLGVHAGKLHERAAVRLPPAMLTSRQGKTIQREVIRGVFGLPRKRL